MGQGYEISEGNNHDLYEIEGKVFPQESLVPNPNWIADTKVMTKGGYHMGFLREDGSFIIHNVPSGSYVVEVISPNYTYEPVRVEINSKGKLRARKVNYIQTSQVVTVPYPLKMKPLGPTRFFYTREQWRVADFLFSPMVLMMILPTLLILALPRMMNDPETRKEMEQLNNLAKYDMPEMSEVITSFFGGAEKPKPKPARASDLVKSFFAGADKQKPKPVKSAKKSKQSSS